MNFNRVVAIAAINVAGVFACDNVIVSAQSENWREGDPEFAALITANDEYLPSESLIRQTASGRPMFASESVGPFAEELFQRGG